MSHTIKYKTHLFTFPLMWTWNPTCFLSLCNLQSLTPQLFSQAVSPFMVSFLYPSWWNSMVCLILQSLSCWHPCFLCPHVHLLHLACKPPTHIFFPSEMLLLQNLGFWKILETVTLHGYWCRCRFIASNVSGVYNPLTFPPTLSHSS